MIHYLDASALVKRYVDEAGSAAIRPLFRGRLVATVRIAYAELAATLGRLAREGSLEDDARERIVASLDRDFAAMTIVEVRPTLVRQVPRLVARRPLRAYDAVHLAAALTVRDSGSAVTFWGADRGLVDAARAEGLRTNLLP